MSSSDNPRLLGGELTIRALLLGVLLSVLLSAANAYLGLFAGMTVSASIPAAVISMGILRVVRGSLLENNLVQTAASAGESAAAGAIFTLPALLLLGAWSEFNFTLCALLVAVGGVLGVLFTIVLRVPLVVEGQLPYPEGTATAEVLRVGHAASPPESSENAGLKWLLGGAVGGAFCKWVLAGLGWTRATVEAVFPVSGAVFYGGFATSPALFAVGAIVGLRVSLLIFLGGAINWLFVLPWLTAARAAADADLSAVWSTWSEQTRYLGVGAMMVAGFAALFEVRRSLLLAVRLSLRSFAGRPAQGSTDLPRSWMIGVLSAATACLVGVFAWLLGSLGIALLVALLAMLLGFLFSSVAGYMAGLVGSSNNPVSGVTIASIVIVSSLLAYFGVGAAAGTSSQAGPAAALFVGSVVCTAAAIGGDNLQDLKAGHLLGAHPGRQQIMQLLGVLAAALVLGPVLQVLADAYGFGEKSVQHPQALRAPQATLMAAVTRGVFGGDLPWEMVFWGAVLGALVVLADQLAALHGRLGRVPPLAVALGLYLPWELSVAVLFGGLVAGTKGAQPSARGTLAAAGLITGEALLGIVLAARVAFLGSPAATAGLSSSLSLSLSLLVVAASLSFLFAACRLPGVASGGPAKG